MKTYKVEEIFAIMQEIEDSCDDTSRDEWYTTEFWFTKHGLDKLRDELNKRELKEIK